MFIGTNDFVQDAVDSLNSVELSHLIMVLNDDGTHTWSWSIGNREELELLRGFINDALDEIADEMSDSGG